MGIVGALADFARFAAGHPLTRETPGRAWLRFLSWQVRGRLRRGPMVVDWVEGTRLLVRPGMRGATGNIYAGLLEFADMAFLLHFLRAGDRFGDIGANVGVYTVLAAGARGARVVAVEPVPSALAALTDNIRLNRLDERVRVVAAALAARPGQVSVCEDADAMNHVVADDAASRRVAATTLDEMFAEAPPCLLKIDVEGYEAEVLKGGGRTLLSPALKALIVEINGCCRRYGASEASVHGEIVAAGFRAFDYDPFMRSLTPRDGPGEHNTLYVRDLPCVAARVAEAPPVRVLGHSI